MIDDQRAFDLGSHVVEFGIAAGSYAWIAVGQPSTIQTGSRTIRIKFVRIHFHVGCFQHYPELFRESILRIMGFEDYRTSCHCLFCALLTAKAQLAFLKAIQARISLAALTLIAA